MKLFLKNSNARGHNPPTLWTDGQTNRQIHNLPRQYVYMLWRSIVRGKINWMSNVARSNVRWPNVPRSNGGGQMSWTHRRHRRDSTVELSRVGAVNKPVSSRDPVYNFLCCWAIEVGDKWRHNDVIVEKVINVDQNSRSQTAVESVWSVSKLSTESVGSCRESWASWRYSTR